MTAIYPGSFDPPTRGHLDIIRRAAHMYDTLYVITMFNDKKKPFLSADERLSLLREITKDLQNVVVLKSSALLIEEVQRLHADVIIRGIRGVGDYIAEQPVADVFMQIYNTETVFLQTRSEYACISSSIVREILHFDGDISALLPPEIVPFVKQAGKRLQST